MKINKRTYALLLSVLGLSLGLGAIASRHSQASPDDRIAYTPDLSHRISLGAGESPGHLLATVLGRYGGNGITSALIEPPPTVPGMRQGSWIHFVVKVPAEGARSIRPQWEADLVQGVLADRFADAPAGPGIVVGSTIDWQLPDGTIRRSMGGGMGHIVPGQNFSSASDKEITQQVIDELKGSGLTVSSIDILHADQPAPAVVAVTSDPKKAAAEAAATIRAVFGQNPVIYEAYYFEIRDTSGAPVLVQSASFRSGAGRLWLSGSVEDVSSLNHLYTPSE